MVVGKGTSLVEQEVSAKSRNGVSDRLCCVSWGVIVLQNHFSVSSSTLWWLFDLYKVQIDHLLTVANGINCFIWFQKLIVPDDPTKCTALSSFRSDSVLCVLGRHCKFPQLFESFRSRFSFD